MQHLSDYIIESIQVDEGLWSWLKGLFSKKEFIYRLKSRYSTIYYNLFNRVANFYRDKIESGNSDDYTDFPGYKLAEILNKESSLLEQYIKLIKKFESNETALDDIIPDKDIKEIILKLIKIFDRKYDTSELKGSVLAHYSVAIFYQCMYTRKNDFRYFIDKYFEKEKIKRK